MKNLKRPALYIVSLLALAGWASNLQAQFITWSVATANTSDSEFIDATNDPGASELDAILPNPYDADAIGSSYSVDGGGIVFNTATATPSGNPTAADGSADIKLTLTPSSTDDTEFYSWESAGAIAGVTDFDLNTLLELGGIYSDGGSATGLVTISGLTKGDTYSVQVFNWADDGDEGLVTLYGKNSVTLDDSGDTSASGEYATGTFVATGAKETFSWEGDGSTYTPIGAISVFAIIPEPTTIGLLGGGLLAGGAVIILRRSRREEAE